MANEIIMKPTMFLVYDYDKEEDYINSMSQKGWQLKKGGLFHHTYQRSDENYWYKLDFNNKVYFNLEESSRYFSTFREQGWELVNSTVNGWHYFRKKYNPELPKEDYEIYTDDTSLKEMLGRWIKIARTIQIVLTLLLVLYVVLYFSTDSIILLVDVIVYSFSIVLLEICKMNLKRKRLSSHSRTILGKYGGHVLFGGLCLTVLLMLTIIFYQPYLYEIKYSTQINQDTPNYTDTLIIKKDGNYKLDFKFKSDDGFVMLRIRKNGLTIFNGGGTNFSNNNLNLKEGKYTFEVIYRLKDYQDELDRSESESEKQTLTENPGEKINVDVFVGLKRSLY